jgi:hypothetical protein
VSCERCYVWFKYANHDDQLSSEMAIATRTASVNDVGSLDPDPFPSLSEKKWWSSFYSRGLAPVHVREVNKGAALRRLDDPSGSHDCQSRLLLLLCHPLSDGLDDRTHVEMVELLKAIFVGLF